MHETASSGYGQAADLYARARPSYPDEAVDWLLAELSTGELVEIGAGTGKFTAALVARGVRVVAVEPVAAMRERLAALGVDVVAATAEDLPFPDGSVQGVIASQSLHWCDIPLAFREFDRVLATDGAIGLIWNFRDLEVVWQRDLDALLRRSTRRRAAFAGWAVGSGGRRARRFASLRARAGNGRSRRTRKACVDRVRSVSYVAALAESGQEGVDRARTRASGASRAGPKRRSRFPYVTEAFVLQRAAIPSEA